MLEIIISMILSMSFILLASTSIFSFILSFLWTMRIVKDHLLITVKGINIRIRNLIDLLMIITRILLPLPIINQPRINVTPLVFLVGVIIFTIGVLFIVLAVWRLYPTLIYRKEIRLVKDGVYGIIRHPIYFGDSIWPLGWSIIFGALYSASLTPVWLFIYILTTFREEEHLIKKYGEEYDNYRRKVKRIIPFIY